MKEKTNINFSILKLSTVELFMQFGARAIPTCSLTFLNRSIYITTRNQLMGLQKFRKENTCIDI